MFEYFIMNPIEYPIEITEAQEQAEFCGIFSNSRRIQIVWAIGNRELTVSEISEETITPSTNGLCTFIDRLNGVAVPTLLDISSQLTVQLYVPLFSMAVKL